MSNEYIERLRKAAKAIHNADAILIGAGAGLSEAAGLHYTGKRFIDNFGEFIERYGMEDMYTATFYPFQTEEERWAFWAKFIEVNRFAPGATQIYLDLLKLVQDREYFVITTNVDGQFEKAGFPKEKIYAVQGDCGYLQCAKGCHDKLYDNESLMRGMLAHTRNAKIPSVLIPKCPVCGGKMDVNLRKDLCFVQDENWYWMEKNYESFLRKNGKKRIVLLELGVGYNTPGIIRIPFEQMAYQNKKATLIRINLHHSDGAKENIDKTISFTEDMANVIRSWVDPNAGFGKSLFLSSLNIHVGSTHYTSSP